MNYNNCIKSLLLMIDVLQKNSFNNFNCQNLCEKDYLGPSFNCSFYNTRVVTFYNKQGNLFETFYFDNDMQYSSSYFRICNISDDCCKLLILKNENETFYSTGQYITLKLNCICAVKCLEDVIINNL